MTMMTSRPEQVGDSVQSGVVMYAFGTDVAL